MRAHVPRRAQSAQTPIPMGNRSPTSRPCRPRVSCTSSPSSGVRRRPCAHRRRDVAALVTLMLECPVVVLGVFSGASETEDAGVRVLDAEQGDGVRGAKVCAAEPVCVGVQYGERVVVEPVECRECTAGGLVRGRSAARAVTLALVHRGYPMGRCWRRRPCGEGRRPSRSRRFWHRRRA